jgi:hypothetical protein
VPISPHQAEDLAKAALELYADAERIMLEKVADRIARGIDEPGWAERKLLEVQQLRGDVEAQLRRLTEEGRDAATDAITTAYNRGVATAGADLKAAGVSTELAFGRVNLATVNALVEASVTRLEGTHLRILRSTLDGYRGVVEKTAGQVAVGTLTRREASVEALDAFAKRGIKGFVDSAGRSWDLPSYAEMTMRTASGQAAVQGHMNRLVENGHDLVIVSDAPEECRLCRPWEGKVLSITGYTRGKASGPNLNNDSGGTVTIDVAGTVAEATADGLFHPNCRHATGMYIPGVTRPMRGTADPEGDKLRRDQRRLERDVRAAKKELALWKSARDRAAVEDRVKRLPASDPFEARYREAREHLAARRERLAGFIDEHGRKDLAYRTSLVAR